MYRPKVVSELEEFYGSLLYALDQYPTVQTHLQAIADRMWSGLQNGLAPVLSEISNYHPRCLGKSYEDILALGLTAVDCRLTVAAEYGFLTWEELQSKAPIAYDPEFEAAVNHLLSGDFAALRQQVHYQPDLVSRRSAYGHRATLLHYTGSNGVEFWRQRVPDNLLAMARFLIESGADRSATMKVYGGAYTAHELASTSAHPVAAGIGPALVAILDYPD